MTQPSVTLTCLACGWAGAQTLDLTWLSRHHGVVSASFICGECKARSTSPLSPRALQACVDHGVKIRDLIALVGGIPPQGLPLDDDDEIAFGRELEAKP